MQVNAYLQIIYFTFCELQKQKLKLCQGLWWCAWKSYVDKLQNSKQRIFVFGLLCVWPSINLLILVSRTRFPRKMCGWIHILWLCIHAYSVPQECLTFCDPMDCSLPGPSVHGIFQARILEQVAISRESSLPRNWTHVSCIFCIAGGFFICWAITMCETIISHNFVLS